MALVYIGLGTNLGDRGANLRRALDELARLLEIDAVSSVYRSDPIGYADQPDFWNLAVRGRTELPPEDVLKGLKRIERGLGRRPSFRDAPRIIDLDLLLYDDVRLSTPTLELPHPRMTERGFVLAPLAELDPGLRHPATGARLAELWAHGAFGDVERVLPPPAVGSPSQGSGSGREAGP